MKEDKLTDEFLDLKVNDCVISFGDRYVKEYDIKIDSIQNSLKVQNLYS